MPFWVVVMARSPGAGPVRAAAGSIVLGVALFWLTLRHAPNRLKAESVRVSVPEGGRAPLAVGRGSAAPPRPAGGGGGGGDGCPQSALGCATLFTAGHSSANLRLVHGCDAAGKKAAEAPALVYIAGRQPRGVNFSKQGDGVKGLQEAQVSIFSACQLASSPLHFHVFLSSADADPASGGRDCSLCRLAAACAAGLGQNSAGLFGSSPYDERQTVPSQTAVAWFTAHPLSDEILWWFHDELGMAEFNHHSSWFGYTKLWLPRLLPDANWILFIDTDTMFLRDPWQLLDTRLAMTAEQAISASEIKGMGYAVRINSGAMLMSLDRLRAGGWERALLSAISRNRGWPPGLATSSSADGIQVRGEGEALRHGPARTVRAAGYSLEERPCNEFGSAYGFYYDPGYQMCLVKPCTDNPNLCKKGLPRLRALPPRACGGGRPPLPRAALWEATAGDQEFFSSVLSYDHASWWHSMNAGGDVHRHLQGGAELICTRSAVKDTVILHSALNLRSALHGQEMLRADPKAPAHVLASACEQPDVPGPPGPMGTMGAIGVMMAMARKRCGETEWLGIQSSAAACGARVLAEPAAAGCSHTHFVFADDGNCACAPSEAKCVDRASGVKSAAVASLYTINGTMTTASRTTPAAASADNIDAGCDNPCGRVELPVIRHCPITPKDLRAFVDDRMTGTELCGQCSFA